MIVIETVIFIAAIWRTAIYNKNPKRQTASHAISCKSSKKRIILEFAFIHTLHLYTYHCFITVMVPDYGHPCITSDSMARCTGCEITFEETIEIFLKKTALQSNFLIVTVYHQQKLSLTVVIETAITIQIDKRFQCNRQRNNQKINK